MARLSAKLWTDPDTFATILLTLGIDTFHNPKDKYIQCLDWHPKTWIAEIKEEWGVVPHIRNIHRLMAACLLLKKPDEFYKTESGFSVICRALASEWFDYSVADIPSTADMAWGIIEANLLDPGDDNTFDDNVNAFINYVVKFEGFNALPTIFHTFGVRNRKDIIVKYDYSEDPDLALAVAENMTEREKDLTTWIKDQLKLLAKQLMSMDIRSGQQMVTAQEVLQIAENIKVPVEIE